MSDIGPPFSEDDFMKFAREFDFIHTTSSPHFHQSNGFIEAMVKKVKNAYKKTDGSSTAQARALLQLHDTPIVADLPSPAEILHGRPAQGAVVPRHPKQINMRQIQQRLIEIQDAQKQKFDRSHRAKNLQVLKINEQVCFFPNKQGMGHLTWLTGTVSQILDCGHSHMITGSNSRVYRRNRAHLKPICYDSISFQNHGTGKKDEKCKVDSFQDPKKDGEKVKTMSFQTDTADITARAMILDQKSNNHPSHTSSHQHYSPRSPWYSPHHQSHPGKAQWNLMQRKPHPEAG